MCWAEEPMRNKILIYFHEWNFAVSVTATGDNAIFIMVK